MSIPYEADAAKHSHAAGNDIRVPNRAIGRDIGSLSDSYCQRCEVRRKTVECLVGRSTPVRQACIGQSGQRRMRRRNVNVVGIRMSHGKARTERTIQERHGRARRGVVIVTAEGDVHAGFAHFIDGKIHAVFGQCYGTWSI